MYTASLLAEMRLEARSSRYAVNVGTLERQDIGPNLILQLEQNKEETSENVKA